MHNYTDERVMGTKASLDEYGRFVMSADEAVEMMLEGKDISGAYILEGTDVISYNEHCSSMGMHPINVYKELDVELEEFHGENCETWFIPWEYTIHDMKEYVLGLCDTDIERERVCEEMVLFEERGMIPMLRYIRYMIDVMKEHNVVWGVGRGSSVSLYTLFVMGLHKVDSIEYELDYMEFFK